MRLLYWVLSIDNVYLVLEFASVFDRLQYATQCSMNSCRASGQERGRLMWIGCACVDDLIEKHKHRLLKVTESVRKHVYPRTYQPGCYLDVKSQTEYTS